MSKRKPARPRRARSASKIRSKAAGGGQPKGRANSKQANDFLPRARVLHPWPQERFAVKYPRWEPSARMGPARFCAGGAQ